MTKRNLILFTVLFSTMLSTCIAVSMMFSTNYMVNDIRNQTYVIPIQEEPEIQQIPAFEFTPFSEAYGEQEVAQEPVEKEEVKPEPKPEPKVEPQPNPIGEHIVMNVTGYTAGYESTQKQKGEVGYGVTASGAYVQQGRTIAAGKQIPFGTKIYIPYFEGKPGFGDGVFTVEDRGGAIKAYNIDVYFDSLNEARQFGRQNLDVYILEGK